MRTKLNLFLLLALLVLPTGCSKTTLAPDGVYASQPTGLYAQDVGILAARDMLHTFVKWEYENRAALKQTPEITKYADYVRANARKWVNSALAMRDAYAASPTGDNLANLTAAMNVLRAALTQSTQYMTFTIH